jgi:hypothetical protein
MDDREKCAHPSCECLAADDSDYCSTYCEGVGDTADIMCNCGHAACSGKAATILMEPA